MRYSTCCQMYVLIFLSAMIFVSTESVEHIYSRNRRSFIDFGSMVRCTTGRNPFDYLDYGCYCGLGGKGKVLDDVDRCCHDHDDCYRQLRKKKICSRFQVYFTSYDHTCSTCAKKNKGCSKELCRCDRKAALCFERSKYNPKMKNVVRSKMC